MLQADLDFQDVSGIRVAKSFKELSRIPGCRGELTVKFVMRGEDDAPAATASWVQYEGLHPALYTHEIRLFDDDLTTFRTKRRKLAQVKSELLQYVKDKLTLALVDKACDTWRNPEGSRKQPLFTRDEMGDVATQVLRQVSLFMGFSFEGKLTVACLEGTEIFYHLDSGHSNDNS